MISHWVSYDSKEPFVPNLDKFGFVYLITNTKTTKAYVGCKQYFSMGKKKRKHKWEIYTGSSKYLNADIEKIGKEHFTFEVIAEYKNRRSLRYYEMYYQVKWNVLTATIEGSDEPSFYNSYVGGKFFPPVELYKDPDHIKKMRERNHDNPEVQKRKSKSLKKRENDPEYKERMRKNNYDNKEVKAKLREQNIGDKSTSALGAHELEFKCGKVIIVDNLSRFAIDNNYDWSALRHLKIGYKIQQGKKINMYKHKDIVKVKLIGKEETNVSKESNVRHSTS